MNRFKKTATWISVICITLAMIAGCTAVPEKKTGSGKNYESEKKREGSSY